MGKDTSFSKTGSLNLGGKLVALEPPLIMGILNLTPDSFFDGGRYQDQDTVRKQIDSLITDGARIVDAGACSSRPGAADISAGEEKKRLDLGLSLLRKYHPNMPVSVDTYRSSVADWAITTYHVEMINDISSGDLDSKMFETIARHQVAYVAMHMQGRPQTMQDHPVYKHVVQDIITELSRKISVLKALGVNDVIADPGFGFGKTLEHNYQILNGLSAFRMLEVPILVGLSRKSMIYRLLDISPEEALNGTTVVNTLALLQGADILRVHDPAAAREAVKIIEMYQKCSLPDQFES